MTDNSNDDHQDNQRTPEAREHFVNATLAALQLDPCAHAEAQAGVFLADALPATAKQLMAAHLATCGSCAGLFAVLARLDRQLPALAHRPAPAGFALRVVAATSDKVRRRDAVSLLQKLLQRPRFAAEAAYCGALAWSLVLGLPSLDARLLQESGELLRSFGATNAELLARGSNVGKEQLQSAQAQLQTLYEQGTGRVEATLDKIEPIYAELFR